MRALISVLVVVAAIGTAAWADGPSNEELLKKLQALEAEVKELRAERAREPRTAAYDPRDVDATIEAVQKDAKQHTLLFPPGSAGHNFERGFFIRSDDGQFVLYPDLMVQVRGVAAYRQDGKHGSDSSTENGFEIRRAKIGSTPTTAGHGGVGVHSGAESYATFRSRQMRDDLFDDIHLPARYCRAMRLLLIRHGKAGDPEKWAKTGKDDALRPLTAAGKKEMKSAAKRLRRLVSRIHALATSPYKRAVKTAEVIYAAYDDKPQFIEAPILQGGPPAKLVTYLRDHDLDAFDSTVALVGHEPHLSQWTAWFLTGKEKPLVKFKKGTMCILDFPKSLGPGKGTLYALYHPAELRKLS